MTPVTLHASIFVTLALTLERYLAVRKPFWYRNINVSAPCRLATYVLPAVVLSIALNLPKFIEVSSDAKGMSFLDTALFYLRQQVYILQFLSKFKSGVSVKWPSSNNEFQEAMSAKISILRLV